MYSYDLLTYLTMYDDDLQVVISIYSLDEPNLYFIHKITWDDSCILMYIQKECKLLTVGTLRMELYQYENKEVYATGKDTWLTIENIEINNNQLILHYDDFIQNSSF